jgi:histidinol-phosphatase (PHP family)
MSLKALSEQSEQFVEEAQRLKHKYADQISLLVGLETEFISEIDLDALSKSLVNLDGRVEYLVGSVHHVNEIPIDFDQQTFQECLQSFCSDGKDESHAMGKFLISYLDSQYELLQRFHPEVIGHLDLCRLYNPQLRFADYPDALEKLERNLKFAADYGALFEANAAPFRKGWDTAYPGSDVVQVRF